MKTIDLLLILLVLLSATAYSATTQSVNMQYDQNAVIAGRNITLESVSYEKIMVDIDGEDYIYSVNDLDKHDGVEISVGLIYERNKYRNLSVDLVITVYYRCGNNNCEDGETNMNCCLDCNCSLKNYVCYKNECYKSDLVECFSDSECDDSDHCTIDSCGGSPVIKCNYAEIKDCAHNDSCCPEGCSYSEDNDCAAETLDLKSTESKECQADSECDDNNESTIDKCNALTNLCSYYTDPTKKNSIKVDLNDGEKPCRTDSDCDDSNSSTVDKCDEIGQVCYYISSAEANAITGAVTAEEELASEKKGLLRKFFDWLLGFF
jgi:hypothetical protein